MSERDVPDVKQPLVLYGTRSAFPGDENVRVVTYLSLAETVVDDVQEPVGAHRLGHSRCELGASLGSARLGEVDDGEVGPVN